MMKRDYIESLKAQLDACDFVLENKEKLPEATVQKAMDTKRETEELLKKVCN